jgi:hypothetical protein
MKRMQYMQARDHTHALLLRHLLTAFGPLLPRIYEITIVERLRQVALPSILPRVISDSGCPLHPSEIIAAPVIASHYCTFLVEHADGDWLTAPAGLIAHKFQSHHLHVPGKNKTSVDH